MQLNEGGKYNTVGTVPKCTRQIVERGYLKYP
jgi:hypothetical protein